MGWLSMTRSHMGAHATAKAYLDAQFTYEKEAADGSKRGLGVLASSCPGNRVYYAAAQPYGGEHAAVFAIVCLVRWNPRDREGYIFAYKDMDESMGPCESECPAHILDLLGPTDHEYALAWRARCRARLARRRRPLTDGMRIRLADAVTFTDGHKGDEFIVRRRGRRTALIDPASGQGYRVSRLMDRDWCVVPVTRIHATRFG